MRVCSVAVVFAVSNYPRFLTFGRSPRLFHCTICSNRNIIRTSEPKITDRGLDKGQEECLFTPDVVRFSTIGATKQLYMPWQFNFN